MKQLLVARARFVELLEVVEVKALHASVGADLVDGDNGHLERSALLGCPTDDGENPTPVESEHVLESRGDVRSEIAERAEHREILLARVQDSPANRTMVLGDEVGRQELRELVPVPRVHRSIAKPELLPDLCVGRRLAGGEARVELGVGGIESSASNTTSPTSPPASSTSRIQGLAVARPDGAATRQPAHVRAARGDCHAWRGSRAPCPDRSRTRTRISSRNSERSSSSCTIRRRSLLRNPSWRSAAKRSQSRAFIAAVPAVRSSRVARFSMAGAVRFGGPRRTRRRRRAPPRPGRARTTRPASPSRPRPCGRDARSDSSKLAPLARTLP